MSADTQPKVEQSLTSLEPGPGSSSNTLKLDAPGAPSRVEHTCSIPLGNGGFVQVNTAVISPGADVFGEGALSLGADLAGSLPDYLGRGAARGRPFVVQPKTTWPQLGEGVYLDVSPQRLELDGKFGLGDLKLEGRVAIELLGQGKAKVSYNHLVDSNARYEAGGELRVWFTLSGHSLYIRFARDGRYPLTAWVVANYKGVDLPTVWIVNP